MDESKAADQENASIDKSSQVTVLGDEFNDCVQRVGQEAQSAHNEKRKFSF